MVALVVMVSSTVVDLPEHRVKLREAIETANYAPKMMEQLPASDLDATVTSMGMVDEAEVFIGVYAFRYGHVPKRSRKSITEMELDRAKKRKIPVIPFVMHEAHLPPPAKETKPRLMRRLELLKERACAGGIRKIFKSADELREQVKDALYALTLRRKTGEIAVATTEIARLKSERVDLMCQYSRLQGRTMDGSQRIVRFDGWRFDRSLSQLVSPAELLVPLSHDEFQLLSQFVKWPKEVLTRRQLIVSLRESEVDDRNFDVCMSRLRQKLGDNSNEPPLIRTMPGDAYQFDTEVDGA